MNNRGQAAFFLFMIAIVVIILALAFTPVINDFTGDARNATHLDCDNTSISNFDRGTCVISDMTAPYFMGMLIALAGILIGAKVILG